MTNEQNNQSESTNQIKWYKIRDTLNTLFYPIGFTALGFGILKYLGVF